MESQEVTISINNVSLIAKVYGADNIDEAAIEALECCVSENGLRKIARDITRGFGLMTCEIHSFDFDDKEITKI